MLLRGKDAEEGRDFPLHTYIHTHTPVPVYARPGKAPSRGQGALVAVAAAPR